MKKISLFSLVVMMLALASCKKSDEQLRAEAVAGAYDCYSNCSVTDLVTQDLPTVTLDTAILYVGLPYDSKNGFVSMMGKEIYLETDYSFRISVTNYSLTGKFDGEGGLLFAIDEIDANAQTRSQCSYICQIRP